MAYKQKSPYKFLGKALRKMGGVANKLMGRRGGGQVQGSAAGQIAPGVGSIFGGGMRPGLGMRPGIGGGPGALGVGSFHAVQGMGPMTKKGKKPIGFKPYKHPSHYKKSPFKTDAILVRGAYDAASGKGTRKYGQIAKSRAFADMVDSVESTVNRSAAAQLRKSRARSRKTVRSHDKFANWRERYERRRQRRQRFRDRFRGKKRKAIDYDNYNDQYQQQVGDNVMSYY